MFLHSLERENRERDEKSGSYGYNCGEMKVEMGRWAIEREREGRKKKMEL